MDLGLMGKLDYRCGAWNFEVGDGLRVRSSLGLTGKLGHAWIWCMVFKGGGAAQIFLKTSWGKFFSFFILMLCRK